MSARHAFWTRLQAWRESRQRSLLDARKLAVAPKGSVIVVVGMFRAASGLGEAARSTYRSLSAVGLQPIAVDITTTLTPADVDTDIPLSIFPANTVGTVIIQVNAPEMFLAMRQLKLPRRGGSWRIIGYWAWELPVFPAGWDSAFHLVSEVWTLSQFSAQALLSHPRAPRVSWAPIAVCAPEGATADRARFGIRESVFTVITMADAWSSFARKNPVGAIKAFRMAFGERFDCELIVKTRNLASSHAARKTIDEAIAGAGNVRLLEGSLSDIDRWRLLASVDALISLHRAEGFGLGPAEAMALGKPVIATAWSGNMSYMTKDTAELIGYELVAAEDKFEIYRPQGELGVWAEPDLDGAANSLRSLERDQTRRRSLGRVAQQRISGELGHVAVGNRLRKLLDAPPSNSPS